MVLARRSFGYVLEWAFFSYLYERDHLQQVLMTYGLILVFEELRSLLVGNDVHGVAAPALARRAAFRSATLMTLSGATGCSCRRVCIAARARAVLRDRRARGSA